MEVRSTELIRDANRLNDSANNSNLKGNVTNGSPSFPGNDSSNAIMMHESHVTSNIIDSASNSEGVISVPPTSTVAGSTDHNYSVGGAVNSLSGEPNKVPDENGRARKRLKGLFESTALVTTATDSANANSSIAVSGQCNVSSSITVVSPSAFGTSNTSAAVTSRPTDRSSPNQTKKTIARARTKDTTTLATTITMSTNSNNHTSISNAAPSVNVGSTFVKSTDLPAPSSNVITSSSISSQTTDHLNSNHLEANRLANQNLFPTESSSSSLADCIGNVGVSPKVPPLKIVLGNVSSANNERISISGAGSTSFKKSDDKGNFLIVNQSIHGNSPLSQSSASTMVASISTALLSTNSLPLTTSRMVDNETRVAVSNGSPSGLMNVNLVTNPTPSQHLGTTTAGSNQSSVLETNNGSGSSNSVFASSGRVTRSSQRAAAVQSGYAGNSSNNGSGDDQSNSEATGGKELRKRKNRNRGNNPSALNSRTERNRLSELGVDRSMNTIDSQPTGEEDNESSSSSSAGSVNGIAHSVDKRLYQMPTYNCYHKYLNIRKQVDMRRSQQMHSLQLKPPQNINQFLVTTGGYLLQKNAAKNTIDSNTLPIDMGAIELPSQLIDNPLRDLFYEQEIDRRRLRLQHHIEKEKLRISAEQEILRVHSRAALANSNPILPPLSVCSILKDEEIYNSIEPENENDNEADNDAENIPENDPEPENDDLPIKKVDANPKSAEDNDATALANESEQLDDLLKTNEIELSMYQDGKSLCVVLQNVHEKWLLKKKDILLRQKRESESLQAIQKLNWQWRDKELNFTDTKSAGKLTVEDRFVPIVSVLDFELLPNL